MYFPLLQIMKELVNRKVQMWLRLCFIHATIKHHKLNEYTNEKIRKYFTKSNE